MRLYSLRRNSAGWRVRIALHHERVPFEYVPVSAALPDWTGEDPAWRAVGIR